MGTRHLIAVVVDGDFKIAQYGQWDGYPSGQGADIIKFLGDTADRSVRIDTLRENARALRWATQEDWDRINTELDLPDNGWLDMEQAERYKKAYPHINRDAGATILSYVSQGDVEFVNDSRDFATDSLFCEWAYCLDLNANTLEVYKGFQREPHNQGRFASLTTKDEHVLSREDKYYPVKLIATFDLATVSDADMASLEKEEED